MIFNILAWERVAVSGFLWKKSRESGVCSEMWPILLWKSNQQAPYSSSSYHSHQASLPFLHQEPVKFYLTQKIHSQAGSGVASCLHKAEESVAKDSLPSFSWLQERLKTGSEKKDPRVRTGSLLGKVQDDFILGLENSWPLIKPGGSKTVNEHSAQSLAETQKHSCRESWKM